MREIIAIALLAILLAGCPMPVGVCSKDSDCPQPKCAGVTVKCDYGTCITVDSNGKLANCTNISIPNPAAKYCVDKGYKYEIETASDGSQTGYCYVFSPESYLVKCEEWSFYRGECPNCQVYCEAMPHVGCLGYWNISGKFPNCNCQYTITAGAQRTMNKEFCEEYGGRWNECGSACTGMPAGTACTAVCIAQCECLGAPEWRCPSGYYCRLGGKGPSEVGVCVPCNTG